MAHTCVLTAQAVKSGSPCGAVVEKRLVEPVPIDSVVLESIARLDNLPIRFFFFSTEMMRGQSQQMFVRLHDFMPVAVKFVHEFRVPYIVR